MILRTNNIIFLLFKKMNEMVCSLTMNKQSEKTQKHPSLQKSTFKTMFELCPFNSKILDN